VKPVNHVAFPAVDDVAVALYACRRQNIGQRVSAGALGIGKAAAPRRAAFRVTEGGDVFLLLALVARQQHRQRPHQRADDVDGQRAITESELFRDEGVGQGFDCARAAEVLRERRGQAGLRQCLCQGGRDIAALLGGAALGTQLLDGEAARQARHHFRGALGVARLLRHNRSDVMQIVATLLCAYLTYFVAEALHCSGIAATIACGIALRYYERAWITLTIAEEVHRFWDVAALVANVLVFFLVGAALDVSTLMHEPAFVIATLAGVAVARFAVAGLLLPAGFPREWLDVVRVAGMRGALSLALALALPATVPFREAIVGATFAAALATIVSSGLTVPPVVARAARSARAVLR